MSSESIENLLYYKDCKHKKETKVPLLATTTPSACPCPRMCCSMCCDCDAPTSFMGRQMSPLQQPGVEPSRVVPQQSRHPATPVQPQIYQRDGKRKKMKMVKEDGMMQPPIGARRDFGFTRENIKSLISQDQDIKKILKDLVRVTMHKVDLVEKVKTRRNMVTTASPPVPTDDDY